MYNTVYRYTCDHHDTQDILQNGFSRVFRYLHQYDPDKGDLLTWIRRIHINCALDFIKKRQSFASADVETVIRMDMDPTAYDKLEAQYILKFIEELNPRDRVIFNMYHIEGYSHEDIARMLSININSSRVYLARARKELRDKITAFQGQLAMAR